MKLRLLIVPILLSFAVPTAAGGESPVELDRMAAYEQGKPLSDLLETRQAVFRGTADERIRAEHERILLTFIASNANPQAKAIAIEWLGCLGSPNSVPELLEAAGSPDLSAAVTMALARIPGPEALKARNVMPAAGPVVKPEAAEAAAFADALTKQPADADKLIAAALRSPNDLLAGAALRRIRAGAGSPGLLKLDLTAGRQALLCEALAMRPDAADLLRDYLLHSVISDDPDIRAIITLGRVFKPADLPLLLKLASDDTRPELAKAAQSALARGADPSINPALILAASSSDQPAAIEALVSRRAVEAVPDLTRIANGGRPENSAAAWKALGALMSPDALPEILAQLAKSPGGPVTEKWLKLAWEISRRHPEPLVAAALLDEAAPAAPDELKTSLAKYADRLRPKNTPKQAMLDLPKNDDRLSLGPNGSDQVIYLNCGSLAEAKSGNVTIRRTAGRSYTFGPVSHALASVDFGGTVCYEITGIDPAGDYVLGISAWDADQSKRRQTLEIDGKVLLPDFLPLAWHADKPTYTRIHLPLDRDFTTDGRLAVAVNSVSGPNAVVSEIWLLRRKPSANKRVLILTGDDYPAHLWRETGLRFAEILRTDPRLEVTLSESPALLGSAVLTSYDSVFLHFKNYTERMPVSAAAWKNLETYVNGGGGLVIAHFGCGAAQEWNGFVRVAGRVWDPELRGHDPYGAFLVHILKTGHPATAGIGDFTTTDELYTCLAGETKIDVLADATSKVDQSVNPMAFVLSPGRGRVFHCPLGHNTAALDAAGVRKLYLQGTLWTAGL